MLKFEPQTLNDVYAKLDNIFWIDLCITKTLKTSKNLFGRSDKLHVADMKGSALADVCIL